MPNQVYSFQAKLSRSMPIGPTYSGEKGILQMRFAKTLLPSIPPGETTNIDFHDQNSDRVLEKWINTNHQTRSKKCFLWHNKKMNRNYANVLTTPREIFTCKQAPHKMKLINVTIKVWETKKTIEDRRYLMIK